MIEIYGQAGCFYCKLSQDFLDAKDVEYTYIDVNHDTIAMKMFRENNFRSVPQIFVDNVHLGGYNELREYYKENNL